MTAIVAAALLVALVAAATIGAESLGPGPATEALRAIPVSAGLAFGGTLLATAIGIPLGRLADSPAIAPVLRGPVLGGAAILQSVPALFVVLIAMGGLDILSGLQEGAARHETLMILALGLVLWPHAARAGARGAAAAPGADKTAPAIEAGCIAAFGVFAQALVIESTVSFLGLGLPNSLGALIRLQGDALGTGIPLPLVISAAALVALILLARLVEAALRAARSPEQANPRMEPS